MSLVERNTVVAGTPEEVFDLTQDYSLRGDWDPFPESYELDSPSGKPGQGALVRIRAKNGHRMTVRYVSFRRPQAAAIAMLSGPWFIREFAGSWQFKSAGAAQTQVIFKYRIVAGPRWLAWLIQPVLDWSFGRHAVRRLQGLRSYAERLRPGVSEGARSPNLRKDHQDACYAHLAPSTGGDTAQHQES